MHIYICAKSQQQEARQNRPEDFKHHHSSWCFASLSVCQYNSKVKLYRTKGWNDAYEVFNCYLAVSLQNIAGSLTSYLQMTKQKKNEEAKKFRCQKLPRGPNFIMDSQSYTRTLHARSYVCAGNATRSLVTSPV